MQYIFPCMPNSLSPESKYFDELDRDTKWVAEIKKNGWRCLVIKDGDLQLWNRHKRMILAPLTAIRATLRELPDGTMLDGELLFNKRVKGTVDALYLFDVLYCSGENVTARPLYKRRVILEILYKDYLASCPAIELAKQVEIGKKQLYYQSIEGLNEGIVLKKLDSKYPTSVTACSTCAYWLKVKRVEQHVRENV